MSCSTSPWKGSKYRLTVQAVPMDSLIKFDNSQLEYGGLHEGGTGAL